LTHKSHDVIVFMSMSIKRLELICCFVLTVWHELHKAWVSETIKNMYAFSYNFVEHNCV
jgi:fumarate reductase subunit D